MNKEFPRDFRGLEQSHIVFVPPHSLAKVLRQAIRAVEKGGLEERGGIVLHKPNTQSYKFVLITNELAGQPEAEYLWQANREEFGKKVLSKVGNGWTELASFHSHPQFTAKPSSLDLAKLFMGFRQNYIYSTKHDQLVLYRWSFTSVNYNFPHWIAQNVVLKNLK